MASIAINTPFNISIDLVTAPFWKRLVAILIDMLILYAYEWMMLKMLQGFDSDSRIVMYIIYILFVMLPIFLYHFLMETFLNGQSIGKRIMKIKVVNIQGNQASLSQYFLRLLFRAHLIVPLVAYVIASIFFYDNDQFNNFYIAILCVALLLGVGTLIFMLANSYNQRLGDYVANTLVIEATATANIHQTIFQDIDETEYKVRYPQVMQLTDRDMNGIRNILETGTKNKENIAYMQRIKERILNVLEITSDEEPYQFLTQLLRDYNYLTSK